MFRFSCAVNIYFALGTILDASERIFNYDLKTKMCQEELLKLKSLGFLKGILKKQRITRKKNASFVFQRGRQSIPSMIRS